MANIIKMWLCCSEKLLFFDKNIVKWSSLKVVLLAKTLFLTSTK